MTALVPCGENRLVPCGIVALLSDFGQADGFVGAVKGVMLGVNPRLQMVDITHQIAPQDVRQGAFVLAGCVGYFPAGTVFWAVVDPGVGSPRRALAARGERYFYVGPDNGLFSLAWERDPWRECVSIDAQRWGLSQRSATFHGRDVFAPAAARLASGLPLGELGERLACGLPPGEGGERLACGLPQDEGGERLAAPVRWQIPVPQRCEQGWRCEVLHTDGFGNLVLNWRRERDGECAAVLIGMDTLPVVSCYAAVAPGEALAYWGSAGYLEVGVNGGSAAARFGEMMGEIVAAKGAQGRPSHSG